MNSNTLNNNTINNTRAPGHNLMQACNLPGIKGLHAAPRPA